MKNQKRLLLTLSVVIALLCPVVWAAPVYISNVPDWNQPTLIDNNLPAPGPVGNVQIPAIPAPGGPTTAWCAPTAAANIMGYYRDTMAGLSIADNGVFPNTTALPAADWRDDAVDNLSAAPLVSRQDLGWYMNTNSQGDPLAPVQGFGPGTHYGNILPGLGSYFSAHNLAPLIINYADLAGPAAGQDTTTNPPVPVPHTVPQAYQRIVGEIDNDRPLLLHVSYWNLINKVQVRNGGEAGLPDYDHAQWGPQVGQGPGGEQYAADLGHTVTLVGYWNGGQGAIAGHPFSGSAAGGNTPDAVIVHNNSDGTLANATRALPLVLPFTTGDPTAALNVPWVMQTEISGVPEPTGLVVLLIGGLALLRRR